MTRISPGREKKENFVTRKLLVPIFKGGKKVYEEPSLKEIRDYCLRQTDTLWDEVKRFENPHKYYVDLSKIFGRKETVL